MKVLMTGFSPFGGEEINPSWEAVRGLPDEIGGHRLARELLPVDFAEAPVRLRQLMELHAPDAVVLVGQAGGRAAVSLERVAINFGQLPDQKDAEGFALRADGPAAHFSDLPLGRIVQALRRAGIPCEISNTAGTYVCNCVLYHALDHARGAARCGFVHVPYLPRQAAEKAGTVPSMSLDCVRAGLAELVTAL